MLRALVLLVLACLCLGDNGVVMEEEEEVGDLRMPSSGGDDEPRPDFGKMRVKELKQILADRGVDCVGCAEKADFVEEARRSFHKPVLSRSAKHTADDNLQFDMDAILAKFREEEEQKKKLMDSLRAQGINLGEYKSRQAEVLDMLEKGRMKQPNPQQPPHNKAEL